MTGEELKRILNGLNSGELLNKKLLIKVSDITFESPVYYQLTGITVTNGRTVLVVDEEEVTALKDITLTDQENN